MKIELELSDHAVHSLVTDAVRKQIGERMNYGSPTKNKIDAEVDKAITGNTEAVRRAVDRAFGRVLADDAFLDGLLRDALKKSQNKLVGRYDAVMANLGKSLGIQQKEALEKALAALAAPQEGL